MSEVDEENSTKRQKVHKMAEIVEDKSVKHILVLIAMEAEAAPLVDKLDHLPPIASDVSFAPFKIFSGDHNGCKVSIVTNGKDPRFGVDNVGTTPAAITAFATINQLKPDLILNAGTAGGFKAKGAAIGDVFITTHSRHHDRRIPIPGFDKYGIGDHECIACPKLVETLKYKTGVCTTSNSLDHTEMDDKIMLENDASVKDMEAASIAWVAEQANLPFLAVKVVTDIVDGDRPTQDEFFENLAAAANSLQDAVPKIVDFILGKKLCDL